MFYLGSDWAYSQ